MFFSKYDFHIALNINVNKHQLQQNDLVNCRHNVKLNSWLISIYYSYNKYPYNEERKSVCKFIYSLFKEAKLCLMYYQADTCTCLVFNSKLGHLLDINN